MTTCRAFPIPTYHLRLLRFDLHGGQGDGCDLRHVLLAAPLLLALQRAARILQKDPHLLLGEEILAVSVARVADQRGQIR